jgi:hypothetical protein
VTTEIRQNISWVPINAKWSDWNGNMVHYFGEEPIPYLPNEEDWRKVADAICGLPTFTNYSPPDPDLFEKWEDWALQFRMAINGPTN